MKNISNLKQGNKEIKLAIKDILFKLVLFFVVFGFMIFMNFRTSYAVDNSDEKSVSLEDLSLVGEDFPIKLIELKDIHSNNANISLSFYANLDKDSEFIFNLYNQEGRQIYKFSGYYRKDKHLDKKVDVEKTVSISEMDARPGDLLTLTVYQKGNPENEENSKDEEDDDNLDDIEDEKESEEPEEPKLPESLEEEENSEDEENDGDLGNIEGEEESEKPGEVDIPEEPEDGEDKKDPENPEDSKLLENTEEDDREEENIQEPWLPNYEDDFFNGKDNLEEEQNYLAIIKIRYAIKRIELKLDGIDLIKKNMTESYKRYKDVLDKAVLDARNSLERAKIFLEKYDKR